MASCLPHAADWFARQDEQICAMAPMPLTRALSAPVPGTATGAGTLSEELLCTRYHQPEETAIVGIAQDAEANVMVTEAEGLSHQAPEPCGICMESGPESSLLALQCGHTFCSECIQHQLAARWAGPRVVFSYLHCAVCRALLGHPSFEDSLAEHLELKAKVAGIAERKFRDDGLHHDLEHELGRPAIEEEVRRGAEESLAVFMCSDCGDPYCAGRVDCAALAQESAADRSRRCPMCDWAAQACEHDRRCFAHGHRFAVYKCDSCCSPAVWNCDGHHYCEGCHDDPCSDKHFPCPGPDLCPLGIPHPPNTAGNFNHGMDKPSFVFGCTACLDLPLDNDSEIEDFDGPPGFDFGYPQREWHTFVSGEDLLQKVGEKEVRDRLRARRPRLPCDGGPAECAERLLLTEQGLASAEQLLEQAGGSAAQLRERLRAVGLDFKGPALECAQRLLFLCWNVPLEMLRLWDAGEALKPSGRAQAAQRRRRRLRRRAYGLCCADDIGACEGRIGCQAGKAAVEEETRSQNMCTEAQSEVSMMLAPLPRMPLAAHGFRCLGRTMWWGLAGAILVCVSLGPGLATFV